MSTFQEAEDLRDLQNRQVRKAVEHLALVDVAIAITYTAISSDRHVKTILPMRRVRAGLAQYGIINDGEKLSDLRNKAVRQNFDFCLPVLKAVLQRGDNFILTSCNVDLDVPAGKAFFEGLALLALRDWDFVILVCQKALCNGVAFDVQRRCPWIHDLYEHNYLERLAFCEDLASAAKNWQKSLERRPKRSREEADGDLVTYFCSRTCAIQ